MTVTESETNQETESVTETEEIETVVQGVEK